MSPGNGAKLDILQLVLMVHGLSIWTNAHHLGEITQQNMHGTQPVLDARGLKFMPGVAALLWRKCARKKYEQCAWGYKQTTSWQPSPINSNKCS
jgi:hypothetical protein